MSKSDPTVSELLEIASDTNAASIKMVFRDEDNTPNAAVVVLDGVPETVEALNALEEVEDDWHSE